MSRQFKFYFALAPLEKFSVIISEGSQGAPKMQDKRQKTKKIQNTKYKKPYTLIPLYPSILSTMGLAVKS
jgi:hypothetical protein